MTEASTYQPVKQGTDVGSLTLDLHQICWKPTGKNAKDLTTTTIAWNTVTKHQANPPKMAKAMIKIVSSQSGTVTFQLKNRAILDNLMADIDQRLKDCTTKAAAAAADTGNGSTEQEGTTDEKATSQESSSDTSTATYLNVGFLSTTGSITLSPKSLAYKDTKGKTLTIGWDKVAKHQASPPKIPKAMLKVVLHSGKNHTFQLANRKELFRLQTDVTARLEAFSKGTSADSSAVAAVAVPKQSEPGGAASDDAGGSASDDAGRAVAPAAIEPKQSEPEGPDNDDDAAAVTESSAAKPKESEPNDDTEGSANDDAGGAAERKELEQEGPSKDDDVEESIQKEEKEEIEEQGQSTTTGDQGQTEEKQLPGQTSGTEDGPVSYEKDQGEEGSHSSLSSGEKSRESAIENEERGVGEGFARTEETTEEIAVNEEVAPVEVEPAVVEEQYVQMDKEGKSPNIDTVETHQRTTNNAEEASNDAGAEEELVSIEPKETEEPSENTRNAKEIKGPATENASVAEEVMATEGNRGVSVDSESNKEGMDENRRLKELNDNNKTKAAADTGNGMSTEEEGADVETISKESTSAPAAGLTTTYLNVGFLSSTGTLTLSSDSLAYEGTKGKTLTVDWDTVTKHHASPPKIPKSMLKIVLNSGKNQTFQLVDRSELLRLQADVRARLEALQKGPSLSDSTPDSAEPKQSERGGSSTDDAGAAAEPQQTEPEGSGDNGGGSVDIESNKEGIAQSGPNLGGSEEEETLTEQVHSDKVQEMGSTSEDTTPNEAEGGEKMAIAVEKAENDKVPEGDANADAYDGNREAGEEAPEAEFNASTNEAHQSPGTPSSNLESGGVVSMDPADADAVNAEEFPGNSLDIQDLAETRNDAGKGASKGGETSMADRVDDIQELVDVSNDAEKRSTRDSASSELSLDDSIDSLGDGGSDHFSSSFGHLQTETDAPNEATIQKVMDDDGTETGAIAMAAEWEEDPVGSNEKSFNNGDEYFLEGGTSNAEEFGEVSVEDFNITEEIPPENYDEEGYVEDEEYGEYEEYAEDEEYVEEIIDDEEHFDDNDETNMSSLLGSGDSGDEESDVEDFDVLEGKAFRDEEGESNEAGDQSKARRYMSRLGIEYDDDEDVVPATGNDEEMPFFDDDSSTGADDFGEGSAISMLEGTSLPPALLEGRKGGGVEDGGSEDGGSDVEEDEKFYPDDDADSRSSDTASFASDSNSYSGSDIASEEDSDDEEEEDSDDEEEEIPEYHDPASAWLTFSETKDEDVLPEADVRILKKKLKKKFNIKKKKKKKKRDDSESVSDDEYEVKEEEYLDGEDGGSEGSMELELDIADLSVDDLETALISKLQAEIGDKDSRDAQRAVNQMLASLREDLLNGVDHRSISRRSHVGMPEDFYDWAKQTARKVIDRDAVGANVGADFFDWGKFAKGQPSTDNGAAETRAPPEPASEAVPEDTSSVANDDEQLSNAAEAPPEPAETIAGPFDLLNPNDDPLVDRWTLRPVTDDPEVRLFNWKGFTNARKKPNMTTTQQTPSFDWKKHSKEKRQKTNKPVKTEASNEDGGTPVNGEQSQPILTGIDLLKMLIVTNDDKGRSAILAKHIAPPTSPDETEGLVSPKELLAAIAKFVDNVRTVKKSDNAPEITSARQVAIVARLSIIELYGDGSDILREFEMGLAPAFAPKVADQDKS